MLLQTGLGFIFDILRNLSVSFIHARLFPRIFWVNCLFKKMYA